MFSSRTRSSVRLKDPKPREDSNVGVGGGGGAGAFTRWLREFRRETYKVNSAGSASGDGSGGGTYHSTAPEDGRRRHSFNAHDKSAHHRADQRFQLQGGGGGGSHVSPASKTQACRRANSTAAPKSRTRNDGSFAKANCSAVATIRELSSSKENHSSHGNGVKCGRVTARMTETCDGHIPRHRAPLPPVDVKDAACGHEKLPTCPATTTTTTAKSNGMSVTAARKSWAEEQTGSINSNNSYPKEQPPPIVRPYPKRLSNGLYTQQLKTVMERCEKGKPELLDRVRSMRTKSGSGGYVERLQQTAEKHFCVPLSTIALSDPTDPNSQLTQAQLEKYSRAYDDSPHRETDEYSSCFDGSDSALSSHLTKEELEHYTRIYEEKSTSQISLTEKTVPSHQHQTSYAQSEGYHSYVSSTDSTSTPFLDRLRRDSESAVMVVNSKDSEKPSAATAAQGRDSSASSGSSSETLKWHGSNSDLSTVSSGGHHRATTQLIAHSAKVSAPQRHHSESVMSVTDGWSGAGVQEQHRVGNQRNLRKLFPVSTYTVQPAMVVDEKTSPKSPPALTVAERINELEKQQQQQQQQQQVPQTPNKFTYFDPEKKHRVPDHSLRAIQKRALLSFYERHQPGSSWRSEPQLSPPPPRPPPIPCRPRLPTPLSRRSSISSEYDTPATWNDDCSKDDSSAEEASITNSKELSKNNPLRSSSCGSLSTAILGPMVIGPSISIDDWVPELPPKKKQVARQQTPQAKREPSPDLPPPPPMVDDDEQMFVSDEPLPPPPPEAIWPKPESLRNDKFLRNGKEKRLESSFSAVEDVLLSRDFNASCSGGSSAELFTNNNYHLHGHQKQNQHNAMSEKSKSLSYIYDSHKAVSQTPVKSFAIELLQPPQLPAPPTPPSLTTDDKSQQFPHNGIKEFGRSSSVRRNKLTIPNKDYCKSEFSARKSVFQGAGGSAVPKQQVVMSTVKPPAFSATISTVQNNVVKHQICTPLKIARDADKKAAAAASRSPSTAKMPVVAGPLKSSGVFPPSLEPSCPPTLYQQSQSKASYLSAYKREPREREKGLPNFEGSYKRTASPNSGGRGDTAAAVEPQDVENVAPDGSDCCSNLLDSSGGRLQSLQLDHHHHHLHHYNNNNNNNNNTVTSQQQSSPGKQQTVDAVAVDVAPPSPPPPAVLSERSVVDQPPQQQQLSKTLPRANNSAGQDFKRSSRTPRTQSDPSNMPNKADAAITTLQLMMMPPPRHSESTSSLLLQKRSQSDLSQVGSTESGYSSLSLNAPSPSHSPTRLSSGDFVSGGPPPPLLIISSSAAGAVTPVIAGDLDECCNSTWHTAEPAVAVTATDHRYRNPVSRSCSVVSSDSASQTELKSVVAGGTPSAIRRKSPEEIECEELSRDLISHLSPSDKLHNILAPGPDVKRSTDYVSPLFRMDLVPRSRTSVAEKLTDCCSSSDAMCGPVTSTTSTSSTTTATGLSANSSYYTTSEPKAKLLNLQHYSRQIQSSPVECNGIGNLQKKKADLVSRLDRKLKVLRDEQIALAEEAALNETLGVSVADRVKSVAKPQEANKFKTHVQEVGHITSLLLSLSGRLARAENALLDLDADHSEKKALEEKKCKLTGQLEEAKELKENIDRRGDFVSTILCRYLTADEYSDYDHFIAMKAKLLIDAREIADKIQLGEEQLRALKETLED
ncbi:hypothetical protein ACI65C_002153 [Semiaphis heraclei]